MPSFTIRYVWFRPMLITALAVSTGKVGGSFRGSGCSADSDSSSLISSTITFLSTAAVSAARSSHWES